MLRQAYALQVAMKGCWCQGRNISTTAGHQRSTLAGAQQAAARIAIDIGALRAQLFCCNGHHVAIAAGKEGAAAGGAIRRNAFSDG